METLKSIKVENFLSLVDLELALGSLNVLVGPNGAGKSNILKVFQFLGDVARLDLIPAIDRMGGLDDLLFRGERKSGVVRLKFTGVISEHASNKALDEYTLRFWQIKGKNASLVRRTEEILIKRSAGRGRRITLNGQSLNIDSIGTNKKSRAPAQLSVQGTATGLATLRRLGEEYEAKGVEALAQVFEQLRLFEIDVERARRPSRSYGQQLRQDAANLASYLFFLKEEHPAVFEVLSEDVRYVLPGFRGLEFVRLGGADEAIRVDIIEDHLRGTTPLAHASFGTVRALALFAMLNDPSPPRLTCLEEIDHGLHPYALDRLVDRVRDAANRTQIILATHSPALVNRLDPSELVVVERDPTDGSTRATRPDPEMVKRVESETGYGLGELWFSGALGGVPS